ncbi:MAG TPA: hypothetical protein VNH19_07345 [Candidatus Limnocylindrales bacterium]|nr:hypothetical protein [Candidatus Limnocylindrales bacterium]
MPEEISIACKLTDAEFREREAVLLARFKEGMSEVTELADGFAFTAPGEKEWIRLLAEVIAAERECCPFLRFESTAAPNLGAVTLSVTGPAAAKPFVKKLLCRPGEFA